MNILILEPILKRRLHHVIKLYPLLPDILDSLKKKNAIPLLVGGAVRDLLLEIPLKDLDIEVYNMDLNELERVLKKYGPVDLVGKIYGVLRVAGLDIDWSVPRTDQPGRKPKVTIDSTMSFEQAFKRRDLTINAMGINLLTDELIDPLGGYNDLHKRKLKVADPMRFEEDPLRFFRVMQFLARFDMKPTKELNDLCSRIDISQVSLERISDEFKKWLLKSKKPSLALAWLDSIGRLKDILPEVAALKNVPQDPTWHPEGNVFEHTQQALDAAANLNYANEREKLTLMYAALCHDLGKATTTKINEAGRLISYNHEQESAQLAKKMLKRITNDKELINSVTKLARYHMHPGQYAKKAKPATYKRLASTLAPDVTLDMLAKLFLADRQGRNKKKGTPLKAIHPDVKIFIKKAKEAKVFHAQEQPVLQGRDLLDVVQPGPSMGELLKEAYKIQLEEGIHNKEKLKKRILFKKRDQSS